MRTLRGFLLLVGTNKHFAGALASVESSEIEYDNKTAILEQCSISMLTWTFYILPTFNLEHKSLKQINSKDHTLGLPSALDLSTNISGFAEFKNSCDNLTATEFTSLFFSYDALQELSAKRAAQASGLTESWPHDFRNPTVRMTSWQMEICLTAHTWPSKATTQTPKFLKILAKALKF